ncbi:MAG TPA: carbohydrate kinase [Nocardioidaceae bacterium]|nr:carbohydrate kinase [Nocardioidaceae bacterium]
MTPPAPFVVVGESLVDIVVAQDATETHAVGGSPMNVAVGLARLDVPSLLVTQVGDDEHGRWVASHVAESGAVLSGSSVVAGSRTSTATARLDHANAAGYDFDLVWGLPAQQLPEALGLHVGSLGTVLAPGRDAVLDLVDQATARELFVSYDPNVRPAFLTDPAAMWDDVVALAARCRLVKLSDEDLALLRPDEPLEAVAARLLAGAETELVLVTRGDAGAAAFGEGFSVERATPPVTVVDTVGAGDSFMAATLAILADWDLLLPGQGRLAAIGERRVRTLLGGAMAAAAVTCSRRGANPPTRSELPPTWPAS